MIEARAVKVGDRIMWAGHRCTVTRAERLPRGFGQQRIFIAFDLDVLGLPSVTNVQYEPWEQIGTWADEIKSPDLAAESFRQGRPSPQEGPGTCTSDYQESSDHV